MKNKMMKVRMMCNTIPSVPDVYYFIKEGHILEFSSNLVNLYYKCLKMGYDIRDAEVEIVYYKYKMDLKTKRFKRELLDKPDLKGAIDMRIFERKHDKLLRDYEYRHKKEINNGQNH